jgi:hypothetical protein
MENMYSVIIAVVTVLGSNGLVKFFEKRQLNKEKNDNFIKYDCKDRISKLEALLLESSKEKDDLRSMVLNLTKEVTALSIKVEFLTKENETLHRKKKTIK